MTTTIERVSWLPLLLMNTTITAELFPVITAGIYLFVTAGHFPVIFADYEATVVIVIISSSIVVGFGGGGTACSSVQSISTTSILNSALYGYRSMIMVPSLIKDGKTTTILHIFMPSISCISISLCSSVQIN